MFKEFIPNLVYGIISTFIITILAVWVARLTIRKSENNPEPTHPVNH